jgi:hypothetical protein
MDVAAPSPQATFIRAVFPLTLSPPLVELTAAAYSRLILPLSRKVSKLDTADTACPFDLAALSSIREVSKMAVFRQLMPSSYPIGL